jgi:hypothetical protein
MKGGKQGRKRRPSAGASIPRKTVPYPTGAAESVKGKSSGAPSKGKRRKSFGGSSSAGEE